MRNPTTVDAKAAQPGANRAGRITRRILLALSVMSISMTASGCLWVRDDEGHHHWRWHHHHDDHMDHDYHHD